MRLTVVIYRVAVADYLPNRLPEQAHHKHITRVPVTSFCLPPSNDDNARSMCLWWTWPDSNRRLEHILFEGITTIFLFIQVFDKSKKCYQLLDVRVAVR